MQNTSICTSTKPTREYYIDIVKTIAILCVIVIHTCTLGGYDANIGSAAWTSTLFWGSICRAAVPLFLMCTGALMLPSERKYSLKKIYLHNILHLLIAGFFWAIMYKLFHMYLESSFSWNGLFEEIKQVFVFNQESHLYYIYLAIMVYMLLPLIKIFVDHADRKAFTYVLIFWAVFGIISPTVRGFWPFNLFSGIPANQYPLTQSYAAIGYALLGFYIKKYPPKMWVGVVSFVLGFVATFGGTYIYSIKTGVFQQIFLEGMGVPVCLMAFGIFAMCRVGGANITESKVIKPFVYISKASFCIYLTHIFAVIYLRHRAFVVTSMPTLLSIPLVAIAIFAAALIVYTILHFIPVVKKWII